jgi:hypothetical protein
MTLQELHDKLLAWATDDARKETLLTARRLYFERSGEPHEEDKSFESRMNGMIDHYLYDYRPNGVDTVLEEFVRAHADTLFPEEVEQYRTLGKNVHSLFEVRRIRPGEIRLRDVFTRDSHDVTERRLLAGLTKGDLIEARLLPFDGQLVFSGAFLYHPEPVRKPILVEVKRLKKQAGKGQMPDVNAFLAQLSRMAFKFERYRNVKVESIYDFNADHNASSRPGNREALGS